MKNLKAFSAIILFSCCTLASGLAISASASNNLQKPIIVDALYQAEANPKISFDFQSIEVRALLQLIAKNSGMNFMISDQIKGNVSISLKDVTWEQALNIILKSQGLTSRRIGNVLYVSTLDEIVSTEAKELKSAEALANAAPLKSQLLKLNYTNANDIAELLKGKMGTLLTPRGQVAVDTRTNSLIIRETASNMAELNQAIKKLDVPTRQVLIEARIVNIDTTYEQELGIRFGLSDTRHLSGTLTGANQLTQGTSVNTVPVDDRLNFNVPAASLFDGSSPASVGLALAKLGHLFLDLELSALEGESHAQIISRPRIITSNQQKATIQTGEEIPYQESTSSGATSVVFKKAVLSLEIVPQITPDNKIMLRMKATQDTRGADTTVSSSGGGQTTSIPAINTQEVESNVLLNNNETIVLGGVYKVDKEKRVDRVPFFGSLPVVGYLFRHTHDHDEKHELLIFITPKIITADAKSTHNGDVKKFVNDKLYKD